MSSQVARIGIAGAGLLGRLLAWSLSCQGHKITVFDSLNGPDPFFRHQLPLEETQLQSAGFSAAGMLSPTAELDHADIEVAVSGFESISWWEEITKAIELPDLLSIQGSWLVCHHHDQGAAQRVLSRIFYAQSMLNSNKGYFKEVIQQMSKAEIQKHEPLLLNMAHAWFLNREAQIDTVKAMEALYQHACQNKVTWKWGEAVTEVTEEGKISRSDREASFDWVFDVRGIGASHLDIRPVRGEIITLDLPDHGLGRPVRLLHPRHRVYIVPRNYRTIVVGATEIESDDTSPVSLQSAVELMSAAQSVMPTLAEARILHQDVNFRPAMIDNKPYIRQNKQCITINGLFRHGWLLAPAIVHRTLSKIDFFSQGLSASFDQVNETVKTNE